jgi:hypothetical protein
MRFKQAFVPVVADWLGLPETVAEVAERTVFGYLIVVLGVSIPVYGISAFKKVARVMPPIVSYFQ